MLELVMVVRYRYYIDQYKSRGKVAWQNVEWANTLSKAIKIAKNYPRARVRKEAILGSWTKGKKDK